VLDESGHDTTSGLNTQRQRNNMQEEQILHFGSLDGTTSEIENKNIASSGDLLVEAICDSSGGRFIDNPENVETGSSSSILKSLSLGIVKVGGNGDDGIGNGT
jgi:hypothetical protein